MSDSSEGTVKIIAANAIRQNGGTVFRGGNIDSSLTVTNVAAVVLGAILNNKDNRMSEVSVTGPDKLSFFPINTARFNDQEAGVYMMKKVTTTIAGGVASTLLQSGASDFGGRRAINFTESLISNLMITSGWNYATGAFLSTVQDQTNSWGTDDAARPSLAVPGELQYYEGNPAIVQDQYKPKTN